MNKSQNKRYQETERKIQAAFAELLSTHDFNDITVNMLCHAANISRPSFYSHYDDINDLIVQTEQTKSEQIKKILISDAPLSADAFQEYFEFIKDNRTFYIAYLSNSGNASITKQLMSTFLHTNKETTTKTLQYQMIFLMSGLKSVAYQWLIDGCQTSSKLLAKMIHLQYQQFLISYDSKKSGRIS